MIKIGIIGSGFGLYGLLPAFNSIKGCKVISICGKKSERLLGYCESIGLKNIYTDWKEMLANEDLDAIAIAVVPNAQYEIAKAAIKKGLHIFAEKPLAANLAQAKELVILSKKFKVTTAVDFIFPEIEEWKKVKEMLDAKIYGELKHISVNWEFLSYDIKNGISGWKTDIRNGGGALAFFASHTLYYLEYFGGQISRMQSILTHSKQSKNGGEVGVDLLLKFKNKVSGNVHVRCDAIGKNVHSLEFICDKASITLDSQKGVTDNFNISILDGTKEKNVNAKKPKAMASQDERVATIKKIAARFINACATKSQMTPSMADGTRVQALIEEIRAQSK